MNEWIIGLPWREKSQDGQSCRKSQQQLSDIWHLGLNFDEPNEPLNRNYIH